jgi:hypothetical protein
MTRSYSRRWIVRIVFVRLPKAVLEAFASTLDIHYRKSAPLNEAVKADLDAVLSRVKAVSSGRLADVNMSAADVYDRLLDRSEVEPKTISHGFKLSGKAAFKVSVSKVV